VVSSVRTNAGRHSALGAIRRLADVRIATAFLVCTTAAWMSLGTLHDSQHADSLLLSLISTQRWTPFYWGQDRYGMLVPLLAMPIRDPLRNLIVQGYLTTAAALLLPFLVARFLTAVPRQWFAIGTLTNVLFLFFASSDVQFDWLVNQPYGVAMAFGFASLLT